MAKISDLLAAGRTFSFEFFPPKTDGERQQLVRALRELEPLKPSFVSITYRGGRSSRRPTTELVTAILRTTTLTPMAHLICVAHTRLELAEILVDLRKAGVENLMALGGDPPSDPDAIEGELRHAVELVELARSIGGFSIGVAAHPIGHPRSPDLASDRAFLAEKLALADFGVTQFFFELDEYLRLVDDLPGSCRSPRCGRSPGWPRWARPSRRPWSRGSRRPVRTPLVCAAPGWSCSPNCASGCWPRASPGCTSTR